jgi:hypothetical protein
MAFLFSAFPNQLNHSFWAERIKLKKEPEMILRTENFYSLEVVFSQKNEMSNEELYSFCQANAHTRIERDEKNKPLVGHLQEVKPEISIRKLSLLLAFGINNGASVSYSTVPLFFYCPTVPCEILTYPGLGLKNGMPFQNKKENVFFPLHQTLSLKFFLPSGNLLLTQGENAQVDSKRHSPGVADCTPTKTLFYLPRRWYRRQSGRL